VAAQTCLDRRCFGPCCITLANIPEQLHHPKEERYLFARLRHHANDLDKTIDELEKQHAQGKARMQNIEHAFTRYELVGESALPVLREMVEEYAAFSAITDAWKKR